MRLLVLAGATVLAACVLVDPVPELSKPPRRAPAIVKSTVVPDASRPLLRLPVDFVVEVRVPDPGQDLYSRILLDGNFARSGFLRGSANNPDLYPIRFTPSDIGLLPASVASGQCHRIDVIVSSESLDTLRVDPALSDQIGWWYVPEGSAGCGLFDAAVLSGDDAAADGGADGEGSGS
ncbi:MAG: hypothetical protein U0235_17955 [Polyangiaceae bacterium]